MYKIDRKLGRGVGVQKSFSRNIPSLQIENIFFVAYTCHGEVVFVLYVLYVFRVMSAVLSVVRFHVWIMSARKYIPANII